MIRTGVFALFFVAAASGPLAADVVIDWNSTLRRVIQDDGILNSPPLANPGWSTRTMAMVHGAMYDVFQAVDRTHRPFLYDAPSPSASKTAAAAQAAYDLLLDCYPLQQSKLDAALAMTLNALPDDQAKSDGIALGHAAASRYLTERTGDGADVMAPWPEGTVPGQWRSDPRFAPRDAWGPAWGAVQPFALTSSGQFPVPGVPALDSAAYAAAFDQVKSYGALHSVVRSEDQTRLALFWAYDRPAMGPPPVLYARNLADIAVAVGNSPEENARLFAMASVAMADAAIAAWDAKFDANFWRPISGIREGGTGGPNEIGGDGNDTTVGDPDWVPLGAPGDHPVGSADDFTPPFPAYTSGHATMGGAVFKAVELFYGTNSFQAADAATGFDPVTVDYPLTSQEPGSGSMRMFHTFTESGPVELGMEDSPEGENATSRIYLGIHWLFDQQDGNDMGNQIAGYVAANHFQPIPEPSGMALGLAAMMLAARHAAKTGRNAPATV